MSIPIYAAVVGCITCGCVGYLARMFQPVRRQEKYDPGVAFLDHQQAVDDKRRIDSLMGSLSDLTFQMDVQVGQHSSRVDEITQSLESPVEVGSALIKVAGKMLVTANQQLQADLAEAKSEIQRQREQVDVCMQESRTDALTNLPNRRAFDQELTRALSLRRRDSSTFSLLMIDIDHFKRCNDRHGHMVGDQLLKCFSRCLTNTFREYDFVARFGGEEFVAIMPKTSLFDALKAAERVRRAIEQHRYKVGELEMQITASIGVKEVGNCEIDTDIIQGADNALYSAKKGGRNRCFYHDGSVTQEYLPETTAAAEPSNNVPEVPVRSGDEPEASCLRGLQEFENVIVNSARSESRPLTNLAIVGGLRNGDVTAPDAEADSKTKYHSGPRTK